VLARAPVKFDDPEGDDPNASQPVDPGLDRGAGRAVRSAAQTISVALSEAVVDDVVEQP
jgi:hypothetical protein